MFGIACLALRSVRISKSITPKFGKPAPPVYYFQDIYFRGVFFRFYICIYCYNDDYSLIERYFVKVFEVQSGIDSDGRLVGLLTSVARTEG